MPLTQEQRLAEIATKLAFRLSKKRPNLSDDEKRAALVELIANGAWTVNKLGTLLCGNRARVLALGHVAMLEPTSAERHAEAQAIDAALAIDDPNTMGFNSSGGEL